MGGGAGHRARLLTGQPQPRMPKSEKRDGEKRDGEKRDGEKRTAAAHSAPDPLLAEAHFFAAS